MAAMTLDEFKAFLLTHLWKVGDSLVMDNLETIMTLADKELNRTLKVEERVTVLDVNATELAWPLPADYRELRHCSSWQLGDMHYNIPADFALKRSRGNASKKDFTVVNRTLRLLTKPLDLEIWYYRNILPYSADVTGETNWLVQEYFDVYLYCVLKHSAPFLREDERLATWGAMFNSAFGNAMDENDARKWAGSPLKIKFPANVR